MNKRRKIPRDVEAAVLAKSRRRCCLCISNTMRMHGLLNQPAQDSQTCVISSGPRRTGPLRIIVSRMCLWRECDERDGWAGWALWSAVVGVSSPGPTVRGNAKAEHVQRMQS